MFDLADLARVTDPADKAALIAELALQDLPEHVALVARRCIILHWFDLSIVQALLADQAQTDPAGVYERLAALPFIESVPWGLTYHDLTRQGLLNRYARTQPELLIEAARLSAPAYAARQDKDRNTAEVFYCYIVAGQSEEALTLLDKALDTLSPQDESATLAYYFTAQDQAEALSFVKPLTRTSYHWTGRFLVHYYSGERTTAIADLDQVIELDPHNAGAHYNRGVVHSELKNHHAALADYARAIELDPNYASPAYNTACAYAMIGQLEPACQWLRRAIEMDAKYIETARTDSDFDSIRNTPEFQAVLKGNE